MVVPFFRLAYLCIENVIFWPFYVTVFTKIDKYEVIEVIEECVAKKRSVEKWLVTLRQNGELHISTSGENRTNAF